MRTRVMFVATIAALCVPVIVRADPVATPITRASSSHACSNSIAFLSAGDCEAEAGAEPPKAVLSTHTWIESPENGAVPWSSLAQAEGSFFFDDSLPDGTTKVTYTFTWQVEQASARIISSTGHLDSYLQLWSPDLQDCPGLCTSGNSYQDFVSAGSPQSGDTLTMTLIIDSQDPLPTAFHVEADLQMQASFSEIGFVGWGALGGDVAVQLADAERTIG